MMKISPKKVGMVLLFAAIPAMFIFAQTPQKIQSITKNYDLPRLQVMENEFVENAQRDKAEAVAVAQQRGLPVRTTLEDGGVAELMRVLPDGTLIYYRTYNVAAARSTRTNHLNSGGSLGLNLDGQNMIAGVWDGGHARVTHQEYDSPGGANRVTIMDGAPNLNYHAAHVTGTIMASGVNTQAKGMAPRSRVQAYEWNSDLSEATAAAGNGLLISNHSYGNRPDLVPDYYFGAYITTSRNWDALQYNAPYYLMVVAAGNDGTTSYNDAPLNPALPQYDKLTGHAVSKNTMVVASADDANINANGDLISVAISYFSSQGPTDDYRIKPDITGNGRGLYSTFESADNAYSSISGTSMASPNVTGTLLLLQEHANNVNGNFMRAATLKGLALHTADDAGMTGPDAIFGWGLLNAKLAAETISENGSATIVEELILSQGQIYSITVEADGLNDLMASISWTDPAGTATTALNNTTPRLVNDLDIRITQNTDTYYPWRLTGVNTNSNNGDNIVDPFERVDVTGASGTYTITVTHKGSLSGGNQNYSLIVTGITTGCIVTTVPANIQTTSINSTSVSLNWDPVPGANYDVRFRESGTSTWAVIENLTSANTTLSGLVLLTEYEVQVRSKCLGGTPTAYSSSIIFTTEVYCGGGAIETDLEKIANVTFNTINNNSTSIAGYEDFTALSTPVSKGDIYSFSANSLVSSAEDQVIVWIDFNQDGDFDDPGEQVLVTSQGTSPWTGNITIPLNAELGTTRMRVRLHNAADGGNANPCGNSTYGQVEDYSVLIYEDYLYYNSQWIPENPSGQTTSTDNITIMNGTTSLSADTEANNLAIHPGASLSVAHSLKVNGDITNDGELIFVSNATDKGQLDTFTGNITGNGLVTVERYIPARRAYRFLSSAISTTSNIHANWQEGGTSATDNPNPGFGTHITGSTSGANGFDATPGGNPSLFTLNNTAQSWEAVSNTNVNTINAGTAYRLFVRGDRSINVTSNSATPTNTTLRMTGTLHTGSFVANNLSAVENQFNFFGNPYPAAVDMNLVLGASANVNTAFYYIWDPNMGSRGAYVTVQLPAGTNSSGSLGNQYLQPGQAAFVTTLAIGSASLQFEEVHKNVATPLTGVFNVENTIDLRLFSADAFTSGDTPSDGLRFIFGEDYTNTVTSMDAPKFFNQDENLASSNDDRLWSIESRALPQLGEVLPLFTNQYRTTDYVFEAQLNNITDVIVYLRDTFTGEEVVLNNDEVTIYDFTIDAGNPESSASDRFEIVFDEEALSTDENAFGNSFVLYPNPVQNDNFFIATRGLEGQSVTIEIYSMLGQLVVSETPEVATNGRVAVPVPQLPAGVFTVTLTAKDGSRFTTKLINK